MACNCMGCPHPANCRCICKICAETPPSSLAKGLINLASDRGPKLFGDLNSRTPLRCPECKRTFKGYHLRTCSRRLGFVRPDGESCVFCRTKTGEIHKKFCDSPCPDWASNEL